MNNPVSFQAVVGLLVRHLLGYASGGAVAAGYLTENDVVSIGGAVTAIAVAGWSYYQKKKTANA